MAKSFEELVAPTTIRRTRERAARRTRELLGEMLLSEMCQLAGKSQREVAAALGIKQPSLSKLENQSDMQISTLRRTIAALGGELDMIARFPKGAIRLEQFNEVRPQVSSRFPKKQRYASQRMGLDYKGRPLGTEDSVWGIRRFVVCSAGFRLDP